LWFDLPEEYAPELAHVGSPWLLALLPLASRLNEPVTIEAPVDGQLLANANGLMSVWGEWFPETASIPVQAGRDLTALDSKGGQRRTCLCFTGGVDSLYTLLHYDTAADNRRIDDLLYIGGYDIPLDHSTAMAAKLRTLRKVASECGRNFIIAHSNLRSTCVRKVPWGPMMHGPALAAASLMLEPRFSSVLLSSSFGPHAQRPWGTHPRVDPLLSTSGTQFVHYGAEQDRFGKIAFLAQHDIALRHLHVCWENGSETNCGRCEKCFRTMLSLEMLGVLEKAITFPKGAFCLERMDEICAEPEIVIGVYPTLRQHALELGRKDIAAALDRCVERNQRLVVKP